MRNTKDIADAVFRIRDEHLERKRIRNRRLVKTCAAVSAFSLAGIVTASVLHLNSDKVRPGRQNDNPSIIEDTYTTQSASVSTTTSVTHESGTGTAKKTSSADTILTTTVTSSGKTNTTQTAASTSEENETSTVSVSQTEAAAVTTESATRRNSTSSVSTTVTVTTSADSKTERTTVTSTADVSSASTTETVSTVMSATVTSTTSISNEDKEESLMKAKNIIAYMSAFTVTAASTSITADAAKLNSPERSPIILEIEEHEDNYDFNNSGRLDPQDIYLYYLYVNNNGALSDEQKAVVENAGDINGDGNITISDSRVLLRYYGYKYAKYAYDELLNGTFDFGAPEVAEGFRSFYYNLESVYPMFQGEYVGNIVDKWMEDTADSRPDFDVNSDNKIDVFDFLETYRYYEIFSPSGTEPAEYSDEFIENCGISADKLEKDKAIFDSLIGYNTGSDPRIILEIAEYYIHLPDFEVTLESLLSPYYEAYVEASGENISDDTIRNSASTLRWALDASFPKIDIFEGELTRLDALEIPMNINPTIFEHVYSDVKEQFKKGNVGVADINCDGKFDFIDYFELEMYVYDILTHKPKEQSFVSDEAWYVIENELDFNNDLVCGDWFDIQVLEMLAFDVDLQWNGSIDYQLDKYFYDMIHKDPQEFETFMAKFCSGRECGDVDLDGKITAVDASAVLTYYAEASAGNAVNEVQSKRMELMGDHNQDGSVDARDASSILTEYARLSVE